MYTLSYIKLKRSEPDRTHAFYNTTIPHTKHTHTQTINSTDLSQIGHTFYNTTIPHTKHNTCHQLNRSEPHSTHAFYNTTIPHTKHTHTQTINSTDLSQIGHTFYNTTIPHTKHNTCHQLNRSDPDRTQCTPQYHRQTDCKA